MPLEAATLKVLLHILDIDLALLARLDARSVILATGLTVFAVRVKAVDFVIIVPGEAYQRLHREAAEEAKTILQSAEATAQRIRETAENKALAAVKRREQQADAKIKAAEASMVAELRERAALLAAATATEIITSKLDKEAGLALVDSAAAEIEKLN